MSNTEARKYSVWTDNYSGGLSIDGGYEDPRFLTREEAWTIVKKRQTEATSKYIRVHKCGHMVWCTSRLSNGTWTAGSKFGLNKAGQVVWLKPANV